MLTLLRTIIISVCCLGTAFASPASQYVAGKDYRLLPKHLWLKPKTSDKVEVMEFFNYACPWCYHLEPHLNAWLGQKADHINFERVSVAFNARWRKFAKSYYTAKAFGIADKMSKVAFKAVQDGQKDMDSPESFAKIAATFGVSQDEFIKAMQYSPSIDIQVNQGMSLVRDFKITGVPCIVINRKYLTDSRMNRGNAKRLLQVVDYLIEQSKKAD